MEESVNYPDIRIIHNALRFSEDEALLEPIQLRWPWSRPTGGKLNMKIYLKVVLIIMTTMFFTKTM